MSESLTPFRYGTLNLLGNIQVASVLCSASVIEFTIPQLVRLSQGTSTPLPPAPIRARAVLFARNIGPQAALTMVQFAGVRWGRDQLDALWGPSPMNFMLAYGGLSVPLVTLKYNLITADLYRYNNVIRPAPEGETMMVFLKNQWNAKIRPGLAWAFIRDCFSIGGSVVLGPPATLALHSALGYDPEEKPGRLLSFAGGLMSGCATGLATQVRISRNTAAAPHSISQHLTASLATSRHHHIATGRHHTAPNQQHKHRNSITSIGTAPHHISPLAQILHNAALTGGRMAEVTGVVPNTIQCMQQLIKEQGPKALYFNFHLRVGIIASWGAILNVVQPFKVDD
jgi:hypothetical protein